VQPTEPILTGAKLFVYVRSYNTYVLGHDFYIVGEVINDTTEPVFDVIVDAQATYTNQLQIDKLANTYLRRLAPQQTAPFKVVLSGIAGPIQNLHLSLSYSSSTYPDVQPMSILSPATHDNYGVDLTGDVRNDQSYKMYDARVVVTFYNADGQVVEVGFVDLRGTVFPPATSTSFTMNTQMRDGEYTVDRVQAEGLVLQ
jgi:hypothetical protein